MFGRLGVAAVEAAVGLVVPVALVEPAWLVEAPAPLVEPDPPAPPEPPADPEPDPLALGDACTITVPCMNGWIAQM